MSYPSQLATAHLGLWSNTEGLTWSPDRSKVVWFADGSSATKWETWNNVTRTYVSSGTLDLTTGFAAQSATGVSLGLTNDNYLYACCGNLGSFVSHLCRWPNGGAGTQVDLGTVSSVQHSTHVTGTGVRVLPAAGGAVYIGVPSWSFLDDGYIFNHATPGTPPVYLDTLGVTGSRWQIKDFTVDSSGRIWATGGLGDLATNKMAFWCCVGGSNQFFTVTLPTAIVGTIFGAWVFASHQSGADYFVISTQDGHLLRVDTSGTIITSNVGPIGDGSYDIGIQMHIPGTRDATFFVENTKYSADTMAAVTTYPYSLWGLPYSGVSAIQQGAFYDPLNNAIFVGLGNTGHTQDFAWLFFPGPNRAQSVRRIAMRLRKP